MAVISDFREEYGFLGNFVPVDVECDGEVYRSVEHAFQAAKTLDPHERGRIREADTLAQTRKLGRQATRREDWSEIKEGIMLDLLRQKFAVEPFRTQLLATGDDKLVNGNIQGDNVWGAVDFQGKWFGQNRLGVLLMRVRDELRAG